MPKVKIEKLKNFAIQALVKSGVPAKNAEITANALITTDMFGVITHGIRNLAQYIEKMEAGGLDAKGEPAQSAVPKLCTNLRQSSASSN